MPRVLITGANRGIGLEFARQYAEAGWDVVATARQSSPELDRLGVSVEPLDLADADAVDSFPERIEGDIDLFIANAGTNHPLNGDGAQNAREWQVMLMVNTISPYELGKAPLARMNPEGKMVAISSGMGSISDNGGGWIPYRTSKAALNMAWSCLALEARAHGVELRSIQPWLGEDPHGRPGSRNHERGERERHARTDRSTNSRRQRPFPWAQWGRASMVGCVGFSISL
jgi:NAD(P)-dependent dehydrogenase (short-subunit alcohol dehydrogenase family)